MAMFEVKTGRAEPALVSAEGPTVDFTAGDHPSGTFLRSTPEEREHLANVLRLRVAMALGAVIWPSFATMDWMMCKFVYPASFGQVLAIRLAATPLQLLFLYRLRRKPPPGPQAVLFFDTTTFVWGSASLAVLSAFMGGIGGPYTPGVFIVLICRNAFLVQPWKRSVVPNVLIVLTHFAVLGFAEAFYPGSVLTLGTTRSLSLMALHFSSLSCGAVMLTAASNTTWALRRRVFEARHLGRYRLLSRIAEGGHGEVWRAYHPGLRQDVAIKVLRSEISEDARALARFEREIDALCRLRHPHTIRIMDYGVTTDGICYYAMELLEGMTLAQLVRTHGTLEPTRAVHLALQVAQALAEAHHHGIVHRDIKPENVFVLSSDSVADFAKVLDFGIAKRHEQLIPDPRLTGTGMVVGTPAFMAPEVAFGEPADLRADVYGVGTLVHFMLTGAPPEFGSNPELPQNYKADLRYVIARCTARKPDARYKDASALIEALSAVKDAYVWRPAQAQGGDLAAPDALATRTIPMAEREED